MSKKGENIYKRKDGRWEGRYIRYYDVSGKAKYGYIYGRTYGDVKQKLIECKSHATKHSTSLEGDSVTYGEVIDAWLTSSKLNTKESTYARYSHLIRTHIKPHLGSYQISKITTQCIEEYQYRNAEGYLGRLLSTGRISGL